MATIPDFKYVVSIRDARDGVVYQGTGMTPRSAEVAAVYKLCESKSRTSKYVSTATLAKMMHRNRDYIVTCVLRPPWAEEETK